MYDIIIGLVDLICVLSVDFLCLFACDLLIYFFGVWII